MEQDAREVRLKARREDGKPVNLRANWVIGTDGAHSILRKAQGVSFGGGEYKQNFLLGDVKVHWPLENFALRVFFHGDSIGMFVPLDGERSQRVIIIDLRTPPADHDETASLELGTLQEAFRKATCVDVTLSDPIWLPQFRTHHRVVDRYRVGRTFPAGDAAHISSPAGGQGMIPGSKTPLISRGSLRASFGMVPMRRYSTPTRRSDCRLPATWSSSRTCSSRRVPA